MQATLPHLDPDPEHIYLLNLAPVPTHKKAPSAHANSKSKNVVIHTLWAVENKQNMNLSLKSLRGSQTLHI